MSALPLVKAIAAAREAFSYRPSGGRTASGSPHPTKKIRQVIALAAQMATPRLSFDECSYISISWKTTTGRAASKPAAFGSLGARPAPPNLSGRRRPLSRSESRPQSIGGGSVGTSRDFNSQGRRGLLPSGAMAVASRAGGPSFPHQSRTTWRGAHKSIPRLPTRHAYGNVARIATPCRRGS